MRAWLGSSLAIAAMLGCAQMAAATPVAPSAANVVDQWMFDTTQGTLGSAGYGTPNEKSGRPELLSHKAANSTPSLDQPVQLYGSGDPMEYQKNPSATSDTYTAHPSGTGFNYAGNKSTLVDFGDWGNGSNSYPNRWGVARQGQTFNIGSSGSVSFWFNPLFHEQSGDADSYFFTLRSTSPSGSYRAYLQATRWDDEDNDNVSGGFRINSAAGDDTVVIGDYGFNYSGMTSGQVDDNWMQITATWGSGGYNVYVDGTKVSATNTYDVTAFSVNTLVIGGYSTFGSQMPGLYDEFTIWNTELSKDNAEWLTANV